ncbi:MAG: response regulator transcription factor [Deltaproteobacteria bacterium]|nr:MAG: response regulator transcription factor [Deltaproteobacteria bacterium]
MQKLNVFLVDDHTIFAESLRLLLETRPEFCVIGTSCSCRSALRQVKESRPDLVLMDLSVPDMSGIEATRRITKALPKTKVVALTMHNDDGYVAQFFEAGGSGYLVKHTDAGCLFEALEAIVRGERFLSPSISGEQIHGHLQAQDEGQKPELSPREKEVLKLIAEGRSRKEIGKILNISVRTVDTHRTNILLKLGCKGTAELVHYAVRMNLVDLI